jgi:site-specific DNA-cytosine methylase
VRAVDCQTFAGGFTLGASQAGWEIVAKREDEGAFGAANMEANRSLIKGDWELQAAPPAQWQPIRVDMVFGNPACSGFSTRSSGVRIFGDNGPELGKFRGEDSPANQGMWSFVRYAAKCKPDIAIFESVQGAGKRGRELMLQLRKELEEVSGRKYQLAHVFHNNLSVGGVAMRKRYFWVASRFPFGVDVPHLQRVPTLRDAIGDLETVPIGSVDGHVLVDNPRTRRMTDLARKIDWQEGHSMAWTYKLAIAAGHTFDWDVVSKVETECVDESGNQYSPRRAYYDRPAPVITGGVLQEVLHPALPRTFTHREVARIQGFPDEWTAKAAIDARGIGIRWWGKGVPVASGRWIADWARKSAEGRPGFDTGAVVGDRERVIDVTDTWKEAGETLWAGVA